MAKIYEFKIPEKPQQEKHNDDEAAEHVETGDAASGISHEEAKAMAESVDTVQSAIDMQWYEKLYPYEKRMLLIKKYTWVIEFLNALKSNDPFAIMPEDVVIRREHIHAENKDFFRDNLLAADKVLINSHAAFYQALVD